MIALPSNPDLAALPAPPTIGELRAELDRRRYATSLLAWTEEYRRIGERPLRPSDLPWLRSA